MKDFIVKIPTDFNKARNRDYINVHDCGRCIGFYLAIINEYMGRRKLITIKKVSPMKIIMQEIVGRVYEDWPSKGLLPTAKLSVKYVILN